MKRGFFYIWALILLLSACGKEESGAPVPATGLKLEKVSFADLNGWNNDNQAEAFEAFGLSCRAIAKSKAEFLGNADIKIKTADYKRICAKATKINARDFRRFVEENFIPYAVSFDGSKVGKFTAYYEPLIHVSYSKDETYKYPIHAKPTDLVEFNPRDFDQTMPSKRLVGRVNGQKLVPYFNRADILSGKGKVQTLLWADSFVDVFVMHIQGPAVAEFPDGSRIRISYADTNGREFKGIGSILLKHGELKPGEASMGNVKKWLLANPEKALKYMNENQRYVFHQLIGATGPLGAMGLPLTAQRSLAVDKSYVPLGALLWLETTAPDKQPIRKLVNAQDVGGAIKGAIRGDFYWGSGGDDILELAGKMNAAGNYYILMPKSERD